MEDARKFLNYINDHYDLLKSRYRKFCFEKAYEWNEDIFSDTIVACYNAIEKKGKLNDTTDLGIENYFFRSFKQNLQREKLYCRNMKRDMNIDSSQINSLYEDYYNAHYDTSKEKLKKDLKTDFSTIYIMSKVDSNFDAEHSYLFRTKHLCNLTYKELAEMSNIKGVRQKVLTVKNWVKENITKSEIDDAFQKTYGYLL